MDKVNENDDGILFKHGYKGKVVSKYIVKMIHSEVLTVNSIEEYNFQI